MRIPTSTPSGGEGFVRSIRWVDLRIGPGGNGTEAEPYHTVAVGIAAIPTGGTVMVVGGDASAESAESAVLLGSKSATIVGLSGHGDAGGRAVVLPLLEYEITTGTQELAFHNVSVPITHTGAAASLTDLHFFDCPSVSLLADGDAPTVHWTGDDDCSFSGSGGAAVLTGGTIAGYVANAGDVAIRAARITGDVTSSGAVTLLDGCTFGAGVTITAPSIAIDIASHRAAVVAGVTFSSTPALQAVFAAPVDIGTANAAGSANSVVRSDHVHDLPFTPVQEALAAATGAVSVNSQKITNLATPTNSLDAVNKAYADAIAVGLKLKDPAVAVAVANQATMSGTAQTVDGVDLDTIDMRVLLTAQTDPVDNGLWLVAAGAWTRPTDFDTGDGAALSYVPVTGGTIYAGSGWLDTNTAGSDVIDTDDLTWGLFTQPATIVAGTGLTNTGNTINVNAHADGSIVANSDDIQVGVLATDAQHGARGGGTQHALATTSVAGFLSAADKTKLDGVVFGSPTDVGTANADGAATTYPRSDHVHRLTFATVAAVLAVASGAISVNSQKITDLDTPTNPGDAANKAYVDAAGFITAGAGLTKTGATIDVVAADATIVVAANDIRVGVIQTANMAANSATNTIIRDSAGFSVIGKATTGSGDPADIVAGANSVLGRNGSGDLAFGQVQTGQIADGAVTTAKLGAAPGSTTQVIYNNGGAFDAASGVTIVGSEGALAFGAAPATAGPIRLERDDLGVVAKGVGAYNVRLVRAFTSSDYVIVGDNVTAAELFYDVKTSGIHHFRVDNNDRLTVSTFGMAFASAASASGTVADSFKVTDAAHTALTASAERHAVYFNLAQTKTWATGALTNQRSVRINAETIAFAGSSTVGMAATLAVSGAPTAGTNATFTNSLALWVEAGAVGFGSSIARSGLQRFSTSPGIILASRNYDNTGDQAVVSLSGDSSTFNDVRFGDDGAKGHNSLYLQAKAQVVLSLLGTQEYVFNGGAADFKDNILQFGTNPATTGTIRFANNQGVYFRNAANTQNIRGIFVAGDNVVGIGDSNASEIDLVASSLLDIVLGGANEYRFGTSAADFGNNVLIFGTNPAVSGLVRVPHNVLLLAGRDSANSGDRTLLHWGAAANALQVGAGSGATNGIAELYLEVAGGGTHYTRVNGTPEYIYTSTVADFTNNTIQWGTNPADGSTGFLRGPHSSTLWQGRNQTNSANATLAQWGVVNANELTLGDSSQVAGMRFRVNGGGVFTLETGGTAQYSFSSTVADFTDNVLSFGSSPAASGRLRFPFAASLTTLAAVRNGAGTADVNIISCGGGLGNDIDIGDHSGTNGSVLNLYGNSSVRIKPSNTTTYAFSDGIADFGDNHLEFFGGRVSFYEGASLMGWIKNGGTNNGIEYDTDTTSESHNFLVNSVRRVEISSTQMTLFTTNLNLNGTSSVEDATHVGFEAVAAPGSPATAGEWRIYADAGTGRLRAKNNSGTIRDLALP